MAKKQDLKKVFEELEKIYGMIRALKERHDAELSSLTKEIIATCKAIQQSHPGASEILHDTIQSQEDELFGKAKELVIQAGKASTSYLQRTLGIGYSRAARLIDLLEEAGVVAPAIGAAPREVYIKKVSPNVEKVLKKIAVQLSKQKQKEKKGKIDG